MAQEDIKKATTIEEQIEKLTSRGMVIDDVEKAKENLLDIGYFRLGFYWFPFEKTYPRKVKRTHEFVGGSKFDYAMQLYYFDFDLRNLLLRYISRIEINFRTILIYYASNKFKDEPYWYMKPAYVKKAFLEGDVFKQAISDVNKESVLRHDQAIHQRKASPAWKTMEFMSFGVIISLYENLTDGGLQHDISMVYGMSAPTQFANYMNTIRRLRNSCAHGKVLYDMNLTEAISNGPLGYLGNQKTMLSGAYNVFKYMLGRVSKNRVNEMKSGMIMAFDRVSYKPVMDVIINNSGLKKEDL